jgi:hypothetical protein
MQAAVFVLLVLSLFAPGYAFITAFPILGRLFTGTVEALIAGIVLSLSILITPLIILDWTLQIPLLEWAIYSYAALVVVSSAFLVIRLAIRWRQVVESVLRFLRSQPWLVLLVSGTALLWVALLAVRPVVSDWDGWQYYLRDGMLYSKILHLPAFVPEPYAPPGIQYLYTPPALPVLYAYGIQVQTWLGGETSYKLLSAYNLVLMMAIAGVLYAFLRRSSLSSGVLLLALLIWATYPSTLEMLQTAFLSVDVAYAFFSLAAVFFAVRTFKAVRGQWFYWVLAALACGLSFAAKIQGPLTLLLIGMVGLYYVLPRVWRWLFALLLALALVFVFSRLTPALFELVMSWHFALVIGCTGLLFALFYGAAKPPVRRESWKTLAGMAALFLFLFSLNGLYQYRTFKTTGSVGGWYTADSVRAYTPNFEWAKSIDTAQIAFRAWRAGGGARPGLPQLRDLTPVLGYEWNPTLLIFALFGGLVLLRDRRLDVMRLLVALGTVTLLLWWLVFGMDLTRQLFIISVPFAILHAVGIEQVLKWTSSHVTSSVRVVFAGFLLALSSPFWVPFQTFYSFQLVSPPISLTRWKGTGNWGYYTSENLWGVLKYVLAVNAVALSVLPLRRGVDRLLGRLHRRPWLPVAFGVVTLLVFWSIMALPVVSIAHDYTVSGFESAYTDEVYHGFIPALRAVEALHPDALHGVTITYWGFASTALTEYRRIAWNLSDPTRNGYYRELLAARNMTQLLDMLRQEGIDAAIVPADERNLRYAPYHRLVYQDADLPLLWLLEDSGVFPATRVGQWQVIDLAAAPESFAGYVTVLIETDLGRGSVYRRIEGFRGRSDAVSLIPVIDISGLLPDGLSSVPDDWTVSTSIEYRVLYYRDGLGWRSGETLTKVLKTNEVFAMPSLDFGEALAPFKSRFPVSPEAWYTSRVVPIGLSGC